MKAVVKHKREYGFVEVMDVPEPKILNDDDVLVEVKSAAICGSDLHAYEYPTSYEFIQVPVILGHEFSGIVKDVGNKVTLFKPGDIVMGESNKYCGVCSNCRVGKTNICYNSLMTGLHIDGTMAEYVCTSEKYLHRVPKGLSFSEAAASQACTISVSGVIDKTNVVPGDIAVVFGPGIVGQTAAQLLKLMGAGLVFLVGTDQDEVLRLPIARDMGFHTININKQNLVDEIKKISGVEKVDTVVECSGAISAFNNGIELLKKGGQLTVLGIYNQPFSVPVTSLVRNEIIINTSYTSKPSHYEKTLELLSKGMIDIKPLCKEYDFKDADLAFKDGLDKSVAKPILTL